MLSLSEALWIRTLVVVSVASLLLGLLHAADDIIQGDLGGFPIEVFVLIGLLVSTLYVFGIIWSWAGKQYGYAIVGIISLLFFFFGVFLSHVFELLDARGFAKIAQATPELWTPTFVATALLGGITSLAAVIIAVYLLVRARQGAGA